MYNQLSKLSMTDSTNDTIDVKANTYSSKRTSRTYLPFYTLLVLTLALLGLSSVASAAVPRQVANPLHNASAGALPNRIVSAGSVHSCEVGIDGALSCWGYNGHGRAAPPIGVFTSVSAGFQHSCGVRADGTAACWGNNDLGRSTPPTGTFTLVAAGWEHSCGVKTDGSLACWGNNSYGQATPPTDTFTLVSVGLRHSCGVRTDGTLSCWGSDDFGQASPPTDTFNSVSAGAYHNCGVRTDGTVLCWGQNQFGESDPPTDTFTVVSAGLQYSCGIRADGALACWGSNDYGRATPPTDTFISVSAGSYHSCGVRADSTLACWGRNHLGQAPQLLITPTSLPDGALGYFYSETITSTGGFAPYSFAVVPGSGDLPPGMTLAVDGALSGTPTTPGTYTFTVQAVDANHIGATQEYSLLISVPELTATPTATFTPTHTPTITPTNIPQSLVVGHVTWQGRPAQPNALQQMPVTLTLKSGASEVNYPVQNTDARGYFTQVISLPDGTYNWRVKGPKHLANSGSVVLNGASIINAEMGLMRAGDCNNDNSITVVDFNTLRPAFGRGQGDPGYDDRADFTGDLRVNASDFNLMRGNFGLVGVPPASPGP